MRKDVTIRNAAGDLRTVPVTLAVGGDEPELRASLERVVNAALLGYRADNGDRVHHTREVVMPPTAEGFEPKGTRFYDQRSGRQMMLVHEGEPYAGWIVYRHPDGQWVTLREASDDDVAAVNRAVANAHHHGDDHSDDDKHL